MVTSTPQGKAQVKDAQHEPLLEDKEAEVVDLKKNDAINNRDEDITQESSIEQKYSKVDDKAEE